MLLKRLSEASGVSSREDEVRDIIRGELYGVADITCDVLGNLIAIKPGREDMPRLMLCAHMDEVGLMITYIEDNGILRFEPVGGIDQRVLVSKAVRIGKDRIPGVIGAKAIHLQEPDERKQVLRLPQLYIDIGAKDRKTAEGMVNIGDYAVFDTEFEELGQGIIKGKAFDDRIGCWILIKAMKRLASSELNIYALFSAQEEVGTRGAGSAAYAIEPDLALVLEGTTASDVPDVDEALYSTIVGKGPAITIMDRSFIAHPIIRERLEAVAIEHKIPYQVRRLTGGGTDAGKIHLTRGGIPTGAISIPCRYIHSPAAIASMKDAEAAVELVVRFVENIQRHGFEAN